MREEESQKPQKRLVSKGEYMRSMAGRTTLLSATLILSLLGAGTLYISVIMFLLANDLCIKVFFASSLLFLLARYSYRSEQKVERVAPMTRHTTSGLPPEESLVRPSALPPSQQQAELLRATGQLSETPAEQLLRATQESRQDT